MNAAEQRSPEAEDILGRVDALYDDALDAIRGRDSAVTENMAFYRGLQWGVALEWGGWAETEATGEEREVQNYIRPTVRSAVASMLRNTPNPEAVSSQSDQASMARAMAMQHLARSLLTNGTIPIEVLYRGETEAAVKGAVWYKVFYDPNHGRVVQGVTGYDQMGQPIQGEMFEGGVRVEFRDIVDVLPDPHANSEDEIRYIFDRKLIPVGTLEDHFPVDVFGEETKGRWTAAIADPGRADRNIVENAPRAINNAFSRGGRAPENELAELREYWERPTRANPRGRLIVYSGSVIVADSVLPYEWPWILRNGQNIVPNSLYADGVVADLKPIQKSINTYATRRLEHVKNASAAQLLANRDSKISVDHITDLAGGVIWWEGGPGTMPQWLQPAQMPPGLFESEAVGISAMKDVSTYSDISRGDAPAGIETGRALAYLHEFQQGVREPDVQMFKVAMIRILKLAVSLMRAFYAEGRMVRIWGENNRWLQVPFSRSDYDFEAEIVVEIDSGAPSSRALRMAEATQIFQLGGFADTPEAESLRRIINYDFQDRNTIDPKDKHRNRARGEIQKILANPTHQLQARWEDDHEVYLEVLDDFVAGGEYDAIAPIAKETVHAYYAEHEQWVAEQQSNFAQQQQMLSPNGGKGAAPAEKKQMASPADGGQSDIEGAAMQGPNPDVAPSMNDASQIA